MQTGKSKALLILGILAIGLFGVAVYMAKSRDEARFASVSYEYDCQQPCWQGIEVGTTKQSTVRRILDDRNIVFKVVAGPAGEENGVYEWNERFGAARVPVAVAFSAGVVQQISVVTELCISHLIATFGIPSVVKQSGDYSYLLYPDQSTVFSVHHSVDSKHASVLFLVSKTIYENFVELRVSHEWDEVASNFQASCSANDEPAETLLPEYQ
jgi:hypothetical protein